MLFFEEAPAYEAMAEHLLVLARAVSHKVLRGSWYRGGYFYGGRWSNETRFNAFSNWGGEGVQVFHVVLRKGEGVWGDSIWLLRNGELLSSGNLPEGWHDLPAPTWEETWPAHQVLVRLVANVEAIVRLQEKHLGQLHKWGLAREFLEAYVDEWAASLPGTLTKLEVRTSPSGSVYIERTSRSYSLGKKKIERPHRFSNHPLRPKAGVKYPAMTVHVPGRAPELRPEFIG